MGFGYPREKRLNGMLDLAIRTRMGPTTFGQKYSCDLWAQVKVTLAAVE
jgi:hypothetical protein